MRIGFLVDGQAERKGLPKIIPRVRSSATILRNPLFCDMQPFAPPAQIAHVAAKRFGILLAKGVSKIVVLIDKERRPHCTPRIACDIESEMRKRLAKIDPRAQLSVVLKVTMFENWLVADPDAYKALRGRFTRVATLRKAVEPDKADSVDALSLLRKCSKTGTFEKVRDGVAICKELEPNRAARNSRSFRRFLRVLGHPDYESQSKSPKK